MGLSIVSVLCVVYCDSHFGKQTPPYKYVSPSGICAVLTSVSSFMFFKDLKISNSKKITWYKNAKQICTKLFFNCY